MPKAPSSLSTCYLLAMPPQIIQFPEDQKVRAGEPVELFGKVTGTQPITCTWMKFRKQVSHGSRVASGWLIAPGPENREMPCWRECVALLHFGNGREHGA